MLAFSKVWASQVGGHFAGEDLYTTGVACLAEDVIVKREAATAVHIRKQHQPTVLNTYRVNQQQCHRQSTLQGEQGNCRWYFAHVVHSHHPLPGRSHLQRMRQRRNNQSAAWRYWQLNDPFCSECITVHRQWGENRQNCPIPLGFCHLLEGPSHNHRQHACTEKLTKTAHVVPEVSWQTNTKTDRHTDMLIKILHHRFCGRSNQ